MDKETKSKIVKETPPPPPPDPETLKREEEKRKKELEEKRKQEEPKQGSRGPKSNLVKAKEMEEQQRTKDSRCRKAGESACDLLVTLGYTFLGPEWGYIPPRKLNPEMPDSPIWDEKARMREAWGDMFVEYGWDVIPPWVNVLAVTGGYVAIRINTPSVKERFRGGFWVGLKNKFHRKPSSGNETPKGPEPSIQRQPADVPAGAVTA